MLLQPLARMGFKMVPKLLWTVEEALAELALIVKLSIAALMEFARRLTPLPASATPSGLEPSALPLLLILALRSTVALSVLAVTAFAHALEAILELSVLLPLLPLAPTESRTKMKSILIVVVPNVPLVPVTLGSQTCGVRAPSLVVEELKTAP